MRRIDPLRDWLVEPPVKGIAAFFWSIVAIAVPTLVRASLDPFITGCQTIAYIPAVLLSAIFLGWRYTAAVALASAVIIDALFIGSPSLLAEGVCDLFGMGGTLFASALIIGFVEAVRFIVGDLIRERTSGIVFSTADGQAWASWYGRSARVHLGNQHQVAEMMQDYLAQLELAARLSKAAR